MKIISICIWSYPIQHFEWFNTTSLQLPNEVVGKMFRPNWNHDIISHGKCHIMWISLSFVWIITCLRLFTNFMMLICSLLRSKCPMWLKHKLNHEYISSWAPFSCKPVFEGEFYPWVCTILIAPFSWKWVKI